ncbi:2-oxo-4-hydroxy-4-carboxy-5-ureidoimidazoline decarboxylase [Cohnella hashimotonis]|uniref:2-oxo-4-hydroxy-4-carboxy-5-ureidoimidazoline decarboxylase n=1 Tax=Cohnella hashimotonis TaxID=2826895 RepID=A0ABT6THG5_9BACL|nr:2-oxo-4-hydroxy-4-carboxy-5-ureidoimidazoline decarboxylase [Cohnella hashimotonis]MDI4646256.1 2-oxo-4-hydroxy-4-carboxy-5-ureidoimidazoline decarboxylase [Cohnella hashimotonis]
MSGAREGMLTLSVVNGLERGSFVEALGSVFEHSPWVAEAAWAARPYLSVGALHQAMMDVVRDAPRARLIAFLRAHPDLGTRLAVTPYSASEQAGAGLDRLTAEEYEIFTHLNQTYVERFGFPFILAVKGKSKEEILEAMRTRVNHDAERELAEAVSQIARITGFRLADLVAGE